MLSESMSPGQRRAARALVPFRTHFVVTHKCNLACSHCYQAEHDSDDLSLDEVVRTLEQLAALGGLYLTLGGGEPLARRDFWEILAHARRLRFAVDVFTNGTLVTEEVARRFKEQGVVRVEVSLHGAHAETHDRFVRRKGAFDRINRAIDHLEAAGVPVAVKSNVTTHNHRELPQLEERFRARPLVQLKTSRHVFARDDGDVTPFLYRLDAEQEQQLMRQQVAQRDRAEVARIAAQLQRARQTPDEQIAPCQAARTTLAIHPSGDVTPCTQTGGLVMGNVRQKPLAEIWGSSAVGDRFRRTSLADFADCRSCEWRQVCNHCMALSEQQSGSLTGWSAQVCQSTKAYWNAVRERAGELGVAWPEGEGSRG